MAKPFRPEPKFFLDYEQYALGLDVLRGAVLLRRRTRACAARRARATSSRRSPPDRIVAMLPDATIVVVRPRPGAAGGVELPLQRASTAARTCRSPTRSARGVRRPPVGPRRASPCRRSTYLRRGRYVDYLERFAASRLAREQLHVVSSRSSSPIHAVVADAATSGSASTRRSGPTGLGTVVNATDGDDQSSSPTLEGWLRDYFREPDRRLAAFLGRRLPWPA